MDENKFIKCIDTCFPYDVKKRWKERISEGVQISDNASFMVLHEICRAPKDVPESEQLKMLSFWDLEYSHLIKSVVLEVAEAFINGSYLTEERTI